MSSKSVPFNVSMYAVATSLPSPLMGYTVTQRLSVQSVVRARVSQVPNATMANR